MIERLHANIPYAHRAAVMFKINTVCMSIHVTSGQVFACKKGDQALQHGSIYQSCAHVLAFSSLQLCAFFKSISQNQVPNGSVNKSNLLAGKKVVVLEAGTIGSGQTGRSIFTVASICILEGCQCWIVS